MSVFLFWQIQIGLHLFAEDDQAWRNFCGEALPAIVKAKYFLHFALTVVHIFLSWLTCNRGMLLFVSDEQYFCTYIAPFLGEKTHRREVVEKRNGGAVLQANRVRANFLSRFRPSFQTVTFQGTFSPSVIFSWHHFLSSFLCFGELNPKARWFFIPKPWRLSTFLWLLWW